MEELKVSWLHLNSFIDNGGIKGREPWPKDVKLYQPYEVNQILLPDFANVLSVQAFLKMAGLPFSVELAINAEQMSPSGKVPFLRVGSYLTSELDSIIRFANNKGHNLNSHLTETELADMKAFMAMIEHVLVNAELYLCWCEKTIVEKVTWPRYGGHYPWPLNQVLPWRKQRTICKQLAAQHWSKKTLQEVLSEIETCCKALSEKLGDQQYFFGNKPCDLDAMVYGHLFTLITTTLPLPEVAQLVESFKSLANFCQAIDSQYFKETELEKQS